ncbi:MAG: cation diffusion facilitator family transporter [Rhizomicrobium sp.]
MQQEKQAVAIGSMLASATMTVGKFAVGIATGSLGLISEGLHSFLDLGATILTYLAVRVSDKPADAEHPYGHGKAESVAALAETILLFVTSFWIVTEAVHRLIVGHSTVTANWWAVGVIVVSILIDLTRARALTKVAKATRSQALEADALHFSSDVLSSTVVLIGLGFVAIGWPMGDALAAIGVAVFVCRAGWRLGRSTIATLIDAAPQGVTDRLNKIVATVPGIAAIERVRARPAGSTLFADIDVAIGRSLPQSHAVAIRQAICEAIKAEMPEAEVAVAMHPLALDSETVRQRVQTIALEQEAAVHHITALQAGGRLTVGFDLEVDEYRPLSEAHDIATALEIAIREEFGADTEVETHIEPLEDRGQHGEDVSPDELQRIALQLGSLIGHSDILSEAHDLRVRRTPIGLIVLFHCRADGKRTVADVHEAADILEHKLRQTHPGIWRIVAHTEPKKG